MVRSLRAGTELTPLGSAVVQRAGQWLDDLLCTDLVTIIERQKALGFNLVRLPFSFVDLKAPPLNARYDCSGSNPDACDILQSVLQPGQAIPSGKPSPGLYGCYAHAVKYPDAGRPSSCMPTEDVRSHLCPGLKPCHRCWQLMPLLPGYPCLQKCRRSQRCAQATTATASCWTHTLRGLWHREQVVPATRVF